MPLPARAREAADFAETLPPGAALLEPLREAAVALLPTTPPGAAVERGEAAVRGALPDRDPLDPLSPDTDRLGREDELGADEDGADLEPLCAPPEPAEDPPELDPPEPALELPDELELPDVRGPACAARPAGVASAAPIANVSASCVERVMVCDSSGREGGLVLIIVVQLYCHSNRPAIAPFSGGPGPLSA